MPLIVICGYPCSGKSTFARALIERLRESEKSERSETSASRIHLVSDDNCGFTSGGDGASKAVSIQASLPAATFDDAQLEKQLRAQLKSAVERLLTSDPRVFVVLDSMNYIKGFRYELFCLVKLHHTNQVVVHCAMSEQDCASANDNAGLALPSKYSAQQISALINRFEAPNSAQRWDAPLVVFQNEFCRANQSDHRDDTNSNSSQLEAAIQQTIELANRSAPLQPNLATQVGPSQSANHLQQLDAAASQVVQHIIAHQDQLAVMGASELKGFPGASSSSKGLMLRVRRRPADLQRLRRQFVQLARQKPLLCAEESRGNSKSESNASNLSRFVDLFLDYLNVNLNSATRIAQ